MRNLALIQIGKRTASPHRLAAYRAPLVAIMAFLLLGGCVGHSSDNSLWLRGEGPRLIYEVRTAATVKGDDTASVMKCLRRHVEFDGDHGLEWGQVSVDRFEVGLPKAVGEAGELQRQYLQLRVAMPLGRPPIATPDESPQARGGSPTPDPRELDWALALSDQPLEHGQVSPRNQAMNALAAAYPDRADVIRRVFEVHAKYQQVKGQFLDSMDLVNLLSSQGMLELRIAPEPDQVPNLESYRERLKNRGPAAGADKPYRWFQIDNPNRFIGGGEPQVVEAQRKKIVKDPQSYFKARKEVGDRYDGRIYILLANAARESITSANPGWELSSIKRSDDAQGSAAVAFSFNSVGTELMADLTASHVGIHLSILLRGRVISDPIIQEKIMGGGVMITGGITGFSPREQDDLIRALNTHTALIRIRLIGIAPTP